MRSKGLSDMPPIVGAVCVISAFFLATVLTVASTAVSKEQTVLRWSLPSDLGGLAAFHALANPAAYPRETALSLYNGLTKLDPTQGYLPVSDLAESWEISDDMLTYTFNLRRDVVWHDGEPFSAEDVVFTLDVARDPHHNTPLQADLRPIAGVEAPDDHTVVLKLREAYAPILANLAFGVLPRHALEPQLADGTPLSETEFARAPIGTGPFRFVSLAVGRELIVEANHHYHRGAPQIDKLVFLLRQNPDSTVLKLQAGETDGAQIGEVFYDRLKGDARYTVGTLRGTSPLAVLLNLGVEPMDDIRVRKALNHFIDKDALVSLVTAGLGTASPGPYPNTVWSSTAPDTLAFDPEEGARLMTEAGFHKDYNGFWSRDGERFSFQLHDGFGFVQLSDVMTSQWQAAGIDANVLRTDFSTILAQLPTIPAMTYRFGSPSDPDSVYTLFHSSATLKMGGFNAGSYANKAVDAALDAGRRETDPDARRAAYDRFQQALAEDPPYAWGVVLNPAYAIAADVSGYSPDIAIGGDNLSFLFWNIEQWRRGK